MQEERDRVRRRFVIANFLCEFENAEDGNVFWGC